MGNCRKKNARLGITGLLLYKGGNFIQTIEGEESRINDLYDSIGADPRHHGLIRVLSEPLAARKFPDWSMGFRDFDLHAPTLPAGFSDLLHKPWNSFDLREDISRLRAFIEVFMK